ncbi:phosphonate ABC transporter ATP-binding protein [Escherichia coli]
MQTIIRVEKLAKTFNQHQALHAVDLNIHHGEMVALLGPSGSGKSTLLRHLSGLITGDKSAGSHIELLGRTVQREGRLARDIRKSRANTGYIFQQFNLVNRLSVLENVLIGALGSTPFWRTCFSYFTREQKQRALQALTRVGMVHFAHQRVSTLSGGQQQRVAIARALMQQAKVILADEPIASLDPESARIVMDTLRDINQNDGITVVVTLHQVDVATNNTENLDKLKTSAPEKLKELKVIWKSPLIPGDPIVWRKNLSETTKDKIYDFFMNYGKTPEEKAVLERLGWAPFRASSDLQLVPIRQLALFKEMQGVKGNKGLNEQDKLAKTSAIQAQLDDLDRLNNALSAMSSVSKAVQ